MEYEKNYLEEFKKFSQDPKQIETYALKIKKREKKQNEFYTSPRFSEITDIVKRERNICQEELKYNPKAVPDLSYKEFTDYCNLQFKKNEENIVYAKQKDIGTLVLDDIKITLLLGQGSIFLTQYIKN